MSAPEAVPVVASAETPAPEPKAVEVEAHHEPEEVLQKLLSPEDLKSMWGWASSIASIAVEKTQSAVEKAKVISAPLLTAAMEATQEPKAATPAPSASPAVPLPWESAAPENVQDARARVLKLSSDDKTFLVPPPVDFVYSADEKAGVAQRLLETDPLLSAKRFKLVPKMVDEVNFWKNYFYRVELVLGALGVKEAAAVPNSPAGGSALGATAAVGAAPTSGGHEGGEDWEEEMRKELAAVRTMDDEENFDMLEDDEVEVD